MEVRIGKVTHFYNKISVAVLALTAELKVGDTLHFLGHTTDFAQRVTSLEIEHCKVESVPASGDAALKVDQELRAGDAIFKVVED